MKEATFGAGCFWCIEACFKDLQGVFEVIPGYSGGTEHTANYESVCAGGTDHAEVARIKYDEKVLKFEKLLEMFWFVHDPTQLNRQGNDVGKHYRSVIFYHDNAQKELAESYKEKLAKAEIWRDPIVTEISEVTGFYPAENYHHNYLENNPENPYCKFVVRPKVDKFKEVFGDLMND